MPFTQLYYHLVWATKHREPLISDKIESSLYELIRSKAASLGGQTLALNGVSDHVHLVASIPPAVSVAAFVGQVKGVSSALLNRSGLLDRGFAWQNEYGVFSLDKKRLPSFIAYVERQKEHHASGTTIPVLEKTG